MKKRADSVIFTGGGVIVEESAPDDVIQNPEPRRARAFFRKVLWQRQFATGCACFCAEPNPRHHR